jgi:hypothetical protein
MSERRRQAKQQRRERRVRERDERRAAFWQRVVAAARHQSRAQGCVCTPEITIFSPHVVVAHDDHCPLLRSHESNGQPYVELLLVDLLGGEATA